MYQGAATATARPAIASPPSRKLRAERRFRNSAQANTAHHTLTDGREKFIWFAGDGREQFFRLSEDPFERCDLLREPAEAERVRLWRERLVETLTGRPEGFVEEGKLVPGRPYPADGRHLHDGTAAAEGDRVNAA